MSKTKVFYGWWVLSGLFILMMVTVGLAVNSFSFFYKPVTDSLGITIGEFSLTSSICAIFAMFGALIVGNVIKRVNLRILVTVSTVVYVAGILAESQCRTLPQFYIAAMVIGLGYAGVGGVGVSQIVANWFKDKQGLAMAIAMMGSGFGGMIFSPLIESLCRNLGWQNAYIIIGIIVAVITLPVTLFILRLHPSEMGLVAYGSKNDDSEKKEEIGLTLKEAVKKVSFWGLCLTNLIAGLLIMGVQSHVPTFIQTVGLTSSFAALIMVISNAVLIPGKLLFGAVNDKFGAKNSALYIFALYIVTLLSMYVLKSSGTAFIFAILFGFAGAITTVALPVWAVALVGNRDYALIFSIMSVFMTIGAAIGSPLTGLIYDATGSYATAWIVLVIIAAFGLLTTYFSIACGVKKPIKRDIRIPGQKYDIEEGVS